MIFAFIALYLMDKYQSLWAVLNFWVVLSRVWLPARSPGYNKLLAYADEFLEEVATFPNSSSRDLVDTMTQSLLKLREGKFILNPKDERPILPGTSKTKVVY